MEAKVTSTAAKVSLCKHFVRNGTCTTTKCPFRHHYDSHDEATDATERAEAALQKQERHLEAERHPDGTVNKMKLQKTATLSLRFLFLRLRSMD